MSNIGPQRLLQTGIGPLNVPFPAPSSTAPIRGSGVLNINNLSTSAVLVVGPNNTTHGGNVGLVRRMKILALTAGANVAWLPVTQGSAAAPAFTATGGGTATDGSLIVGGSPAEEITFTDNVDIWMIASAAGTAVQITVVEQ